MTQHFVVPLSRLALISIIALAGCTTSKESVLPTDLKPMKQVYDEHFQKRRQLPEGERDAGACMWRAPGAGKEDLAGYVREAAHELESRFATLPNPIMVMYVFPHLSRPHGTPVPGYATSFPMYEKLEYALPGELVE
jgi:conjugative transfer region lipoprotein (TIGR03751 family)